MEEILQTIRTICNVYGVEEQEVFGCSRKRELYYIRVIIAHIIRDKYGLSHTVIGNLVNRDHSTICYYLSMYNTIYKYDFVFRDMVSKITDISLNIKNDFQKELEQEFNDILGINDGN